MNTGGDGLLMAPEYKVKGGMKLNGKVQEKGKLIVNAVDGVDGKVRYFENSIDYVQSVTASVGTKVSGSYKYQVCNDEMCLAPTTKRFEVTLK